ncbi:homoserine dehydrogenase family protein [Dorcoceras hygrometricum]|uniref:Homoserine dehydrogenase n=1 Tax=Dorcoceras hygrometricum TaxID=472368 RepID=A0A2Z7CE80_9LAMI|nr:homoserine dehydrogenase family protein [Dorcoceras hygrometricum]
MKRIPIFLMGCGGVGRQLLHHIVSCRDIHHNQRLRLSVVGVCDSKSMVVAPNVCSSEFDDDFLLQICELKSSGSSLEALSDLGQCQIYSSQDMASKAIDIAASYCRMATGLTFIDCSASSNTIPLLKKAVELDCCVVLANKQPLSSSLVDYDKLISHPRRIRHESTVGAGLPVISSINRMLSSGDAIQRIIGSLSGTLGYVMSEVEGGKPFSDVVKLAKDLGYTEPDPRDDLSGLDVARKALILARLLGHHINLDSIKVESLYPIEMGPDVMTVEEFLAEGLPLLDRDVRHRIEKASSNGNVLRYVCLIEKSRYEVGIQELPKDSPLGRLRGSDNVLEIYSRCYSKQPLVIQGAGAGNDTTAAGVLADIVDMQDLFT